MKKIRLPLMIQDLLTIQGTGLVPTEKREIQDEFFLNGPVSKRVAVLDFDPETGQLTDGVKYTGKSRSPYAIETSKKFEGEYDYLHPSFFQVSTFATILHTINLLEGADALGRPIRWAFEGPQLLIIPRAGEWANAFYERESRSLQFFYFNDKKNNRVYASHSRDIIVHETAHAILDGIAPDLYDAITPQALALHEAIADLTALLVAFASTKLIAIGLDNPKVNGDLSKTTIFTSIGEEFGIAADHTGRAKEIRSLRNNAKLTPEFQSDPHTLSMVLSGALCEAMVQFHKKYALERQQKNRTLSNIAAGGEALGILAKIFRRLIFRGLDYLPPGEVSFADYGRALLAADILVYPDESDLRAVIRKEFVKRKIVTEKTMLDVKTNYEYAPFEQVHLPTVLASDWAAYKFAEEHRSFLHIPPEIAFEVYPRLKVEKEHTKEGETHTELIFKVAWRQTEPNNAGLAAAIAPDRQILVGTTLVLDWETKKVRVLLTNAPDAQLPGEVLRLQTERSSFLTRMLQSGVLMPTSGDRENPSPGVSFEILDNAMRVKGSARMLHMMQHPTKRGVR